MISKFCVIGSSVFFFNLGKLLYMCEYHILNVPNQKSQVFHYITA